MIKKRLEKYFLNSIAILDQFSVRTGLYKLVLEDYFKTCYQTRTHNWTKIYLALAQAYPCKEPSPHWTCSWFHNCPYNEKCRPPVSEICSSEEMNEYREVRNKEYIVLDPREKVQNLFESDEKVLVVPDRLVEMRKLRKYTQQQVADQCGLSKAEISKIERGGVHIGNSHRITKIAQSYGMTSTKLSLCYFFAALYTTTPGYLMGQTDDNAADIIVDKVSYYNRSLQLQDQEPIYEEFEITPQAIDPIVPASVNIRAGYQALLDFFNHKSDYNGINDDYIRLFRILKNVYYFPPPTAIRRILYDACSGFLEYLDTEVHE